MSESGATGASTKPADDSAPTTSPGQYWLRVNGYTSDIEDEVVYYGDFGELDGSRLKSDPKALLRPGDVIIYYADGPGSLYGVATITGEVEGPIPDARVGSKWRVPIKREAIIRAVNKTPHVVGLRPPSGKHFVFLVRDFTYIRLPREDGEYLVSEVRARASTRE